MPVHYQVISHTENQNLMFFLDLTSYIKQLKTDHRHPQSAASNVIKTHPNRKAEAEHMFYGCWVGRGTGLLGALDSFFLSAVLYTRKI